MKCYIFCSSPDYDSEFFSGINFSDSFIICADGGYALAKKLGTRPDLWVGDKDSFAGDILCKEKIFFPSDKDLTDSHIAVKEAIKRGFSEIILLGATGGRLDHEYANYCLLKYILENGAFGTILDKNNRVFMTDKSINVFSEGEKYISFFPFGGDIYDFSVKNVKYNLEKYHLTNSLTFTVSNEFIKGKQAKIEFSDGCLLIICSNDLK